jgi:hypothetical protein
MAMLDLLEDFGNDRYPALLEAFRRGYETLLEWPIGSLEALQVGRLLWKINYVANHERRYLSGMAERHEPIFDHFEKTGECRIIRRKPTP